MLILDKNKLKDLLNIWEAHSKIFAPQLNDGQVMLLPYEESSFTMDYINFAFPVKEYLFKQKDIIFCWENNNGELSVEAADNKVGGRSIYFGVRPCDAYGIRYMDKFFLEGYKDELYGKNRAAAIIVAVNCTEAGESCFCSSLGTGPFASSGYDLLLTPIDNIYLVEVETKKGEELIASASNLIIEVDKDFSAEKKAAEKLASNKFKTKINTDNVNKLLTDNFTSDVWKDISRDCISCTGCTSLCPSCTCFNVVEENTGVNSGCRARYWDSCQSDSFTRNAGNHNPRTKEARVKYRIYDKFKYIEDKFGMKGCVGCGRCINVCPANINVVEIINRLTCDALGSHKGGGE